MTELALLFETPRMSIGVYPVINVLTMMSHLVDLDEYPGVSESLTQIAGKLSPQQHERHTLLFLGLGIEALSAAVKIDEAMTFPQYIHALERIKAVPLRDAIFHAMTHSAHVRVHLEIAAPPAPPHHLLADERAYLAYMAQGVKYPVDEAVHHQVFTLLNQPNRLQQTILEHLRAVWRDLALVEWERSQPHLGEIVAAFTQIDFSACASPIEVLEFVSGRQLRDVLDETALAQFEQIRLIPSRHTGPYVSWHGDDRTLNFVFGARKPAVDGAVILDKPELLNRLRAISDDARLDILLAIHRHEELSTQQIMDIFDLNKSAVSRHMRLLRANELVIERRDSDNKGKFYRVNPACISALTGTLARLFLLENGSIQP